MYTGSEQSNVKHTYHLLAGGECYANFSGSGSLNIIFENGVTTIPTCLFSGARLESLTLPAQITEIGEDAFASCDKLQNITFPENSALTSIGKYAFESCTSLTKMTLPKGLKTIGENAFMECYGLTEITFPDSLTKIGDMLLMNVQH